MTETIRFTVPGLIERPAIASGCCVTLAEAIIRNDLLEWRGVRDVEVDDAAGTVTVRYDPVRIGVTTIRDSLSAIDYSAA